MGKITPVVAIALASLLWMPTTSAAPYDSNESCGGDVLDITRCQFSFFTKSKATPSLSVSWSPTFTGIIEAKGGWVHPNIVYHPATFECEIENGEEQKCTANGGSGICMNPAGCPGAFIVVTGEVEHYNGVLIGDWSACMLYDGTQMDDGYKVGDDDNGPPCVEHNLIEYVVNKATHFPWPFDASVG